MWAERVGDALREAKPEPEVGVLAVDLRDLFGLDPNRSRIALDVSAVYRVAVHGHVLHFSESWMKIQVLDG